MIAAIEIAWESSAIASPTNSNDPPINSQHPTRNRLFILFFDLDGLI
ncbi:MAG: hypothetical protein AAGD25_23915 [Cyanobacteria bacterium P01_F01_bin.150]